MYADFVFRRPQLSRIVMLEDIQHNWRHDWMLNETIISFHKVISLLIAKGQEDGIVRVGNVNRIAVALTGIISTSALYPIQVKYHAKCSPFEENEIKAVKKLACDFLFSQIQDY